MRTRRMAVAVAAVAAFGVSGPLAEAAWAEPAGCTHTTWDFTKSSGGLMTAYSTGTCNVYKSLTLRVEIKHDMSFQPDPLVAANSQQGTRKNWSVDVSSCDNGNTATYYGRSFFTSSPSYDDSAHYKWKVC